MTVAQVSARESLHWLDWFVRIRRVLLVGVAGSVLCGAALLYIDLHMSGAATAIALVFALAVPNVVLVLTLQKSLSVASSMAFALRQRDQQLTSARRDRRREEPREGTTPPGAAGGTESRAARTAVARELRTQLALIETNVGVLSEAFGDILPVLDQHEAAGPHIRVARLDYPFFRDRVPVMLQDIGEGLARIAGIIRDLPARPLPEAPQAPAPPVSGH